ncbi:MAG: hypothetical protein LBT19_00625 [Candidatus Nomurabacteria bacterium]|jgi:hypothetical protein|nr:hypothetical protein [Candidatus Nomurabacteria bacterium]
MKTCLRLALTLLTGALCCSVGSVSTAGAISTSESEPVRVIVPLTSPRTVVDITANDEEEADSGQFIGWAITYNDHNEIEFTASGSVGDIVIISDQNGHILWQGVKSVSGDEDFAAPIILDDGLGGYTLTITVSGAGGNAASGVIHVKYLSLDGGGSDCDNAGHCSGGGDPTKPDVPNTGINGYLSIGGYAVPTHWLTILVIILAGACGVGYILGKRQRSRTEHKPKKATNEREKQK